MRVDGDSKVDFNGDREIERASIIVFFFQLHNISLSLKNGFRLVSPILDVGKLFDSADR